MKLLVLEPDPSHGGGSEAVMLSLSRELAGRSHQVFLLHEAEGSMLAEYRVFAAGLLRTQLPGFALRSPLRTLACVARIGRIAHAVGADVVLSSHLGFLRHGALLRMLRGIPFCFHLGLPLEGGDRTIRMAIRRAGAGVAPSPHTRATWETGGWPAHSLHVVRNWVDPSRFLPVSDIAALRQGLGLPVNDDCIVFVGRVCAQKGIEVLLHAFSSLARSMDHVTLVIVGTVSTEYRKPLDKHLDSLDASVRRRIILRPASASPESYYAAADVVCAPSLGDEAFGLTVLEAMACGVPVIASELGIVGRILGDENRGLLVAPGDPEELMQRLLFWLQHPSERSECGERLRKRVIENFGPGPSVDEYERIMGDLASDDFSPARATIEQK